MRPARPTNAAKRSEFVNYDIERGQSFKDEVIRVSTSDLGPSERRNLRHISTHYDQPDRGPLTRPSAYLSSQLSDELIWEGLVVMRLQITCSDSNDFILEALTPLDVIVYESGAFGGVCGAHGAALKKNSPLASRHDPGHRF